MSLGQNFYSSADPGAPVLSGVAGSLVAVLDAILVDGYGAGEGAKAPLGWERAFTAPNKRAYRNDPVVGSGTFMRVDDTAAIGNARHAWLSTFASMIDVDTGQGISPPPAERANGSLWVKSQTLNATARQWWAFGNTTYFYLFVGANMSDAVYAAPYFAGDILSRKPGDWDAFVLSDSWLAAYTGTTSDAMSVMFRGPHSLATSNFSAANAFGHIRSGYVPGSGPARVFFVHEDSSSISINSPFGSAGAPFPDPVAGGLMLRPIIVAEGQNLVRGFMPDAYSPQHSEPFGDQQILEGVVDLGGRTILAKKFRSGNGAQSSGNGEVIFAMEPGA